MRTWLHSTFRQLSRNKIYAGINIFGLSLGLAAAMLILLFVKDEISYDQFHSQKAQIYRLVRNAQNPDGSTSPIDGYSGLVHGPRFAANIADIKGCVRILNNYQDIRDNTGIRSQQILRVDSAFLTTFSFPLIQGNPRTALTQPNTIVVTEDMARRQFGTVDAIGKTILVKTNKPATPHPAQTPATAANAAQTPDAAADPFQPYTVTGVAKNCPANSSIKFEALTPIDVASSNFVEYSNNWGAIFLNTFLVLAPGADPRGVETRMARVYEREAKEAIADAAKSRNPHGTRWLLQPLTATHLSTDYAPIDGLVDASSPVFSYILSGIAAFILLIACINFINLTVARSLRRAKEIGIRKVIGSSRAQLITRFLGESALFCCIAFTLAIVLVQLVLPLFNQLAGKALSLSYLIDAKLIIEYIALFILTTFATGFYPALVLSGYNPVKTLYGRITLNGRGGLQRVLVTLQFTLASFLIVATGIISAQFNYLTNMNLGYDDKHLVIVDNFELNPQKFHTIAAALRQSPDVLGISGRNLGWDNAQADAEGQTKQINTTVETIDANYPRLLSIPLVAGRNLSPNDYPTDSTQSALVNETFAREAGWINAGAVTPNASNQGAFSPMVAAIGRNIHVGDKDVRVVGVVKDHYFQPLNVKIKAQVFSLTLGRGVKSMFIRIRPGSESAVLPFIERTYKTLMPLSPYYYYFKEDANRWQYAAEAKWKQILTFGAVVTIFISCIGLFGLAVFAAEKRTREIGIRKVLGATVTGLAARLSTDFLRLVVIALLIAMPLASLAASQWLADYPYRIHLSPWLFVATASLVIGIAALTVASQAVRAALANPIKSLRTE